MSLAISLFVGFVMLVLGLAALAVFVARTGWNPVEAISRPFVPAATAPPAA